MRVVERVSATQDKATMFPPYQSLQTLEHFAEEKITECQSLFHDNSVSFKDKILFFVNKFHVTNVIKPICHFVYK